MKFFVIPVIVWFTVAASAFIVASIQSSDFADNAQFAIKLATGFCAYLSVVACALTLIYYIIANHWFWQE